MEEKIFSNSRIFDLEFTGKYIFIYTNKNNMFFFCEDFEEKRVFKVTTDKYFYIEYIEEIEIPHNYFEYETIRFFKPMEKNDDIIFIGIIKYKDKAYKFNINYKNRLEYVEEIEYQVLPTLIDEFPELNEFEFINFIQKKDRIYGVAYDKKYEVESYVKFNITTRKIERCYSLYSDDWYLVPVVVNIDDREDRVLIGGYKKSIGNKKIEPYLEQFVM